jgi:hypothetical protein
MCPSRSNGPYPLRSSRLREDFTLCPCKFSKFFLVNSQICFHIPLDDQHSRSTLASWSFNDIALCSTENSQKNDFSGLPDLLPPVLLERWTTPLGFGNFTNFDESGAPCSMPSWQSSTECSTTLCYAYSCADFPPRYSTTLRFPLSL